MNGKKTKDYVLSITREHESGHAREHSYRPALKALIEQVRPELNAINEPKHSEHGAPDVVILRRANKELIAGYAETKDVTVALDSVINTEQMKRYLGYASLMLTNYLEFRFFKNGKEYGEPIVIGRLENGRFTFDEARFERLETEIENFLGGGVEPIGSASHLAAVMGATARRLRDNVQDFLADENDRNADLQKVYQTMKTLLVHDLTKERFADLYAQTLVYGLFAARYEDRTLETFTRQEARDLIPATNPFLRQFFDHIAGPSFEQRLAFVVNELCEVFAHANVRELMHEYYSQNALFGNGRESPDPVIHFYEDFLKEYDAEARKKYGVFYTPVPVVRFIVRSVDWILQRDFGLVEGLADTAMIETTRTSQGKTKKVNVHKVQVLDPATGTGTFLNEVIRFVRRSFDDNEGAWPSYVRDHLLPRLHGFELLMASYTIAHIKLGMELAEDGAKDLKERLGIYLTNSLEEGVKQEDTLFAFGFAEQIAEEGRQAAIVKRDLPVMVVIGNPPYSVTSSNKGKWIQNLIKDYKKDLGERKINLDDDYIKFIRLAEHFVEKNEAGIVAMITNNSFIDGITHRQMRKHLLETFDDIYIMDLHGNSKKKEKAPDGSADENVFAIQQGVAISIFVRKEGKKKGLGNVHHAELWGKQEKKFDALSGSSVKDVVWKKLDYSRPNYFFVPKIQADEQYESGMAINKIFIKATSGIQTNRDSIVIDFDEQSLIERINKIADLNVSDLEIQKQTGLKDTRSMKVSDIRSKLQGIEIEKYIKPISYRILDTRKIFYSDLLVHRTRRSEMQNYLLGKNIGMVVCRQTKTDWHHAFATNSILESSFISNKTSEYGYSCPLYLYDIDGSHTTNLHTDFVKKVEKTVGKTEPEDIFDYIYSILYSPAFREKYKEFLKIDFPRIPYPKDRELFFALVEKGRELRKLHTLETIPTTTSTFSVVGENNVSGVKYENKKVFINETQYFGNVPQEAWDMQIGGYQPAQKWLKDRKGRVLTSDDIRHYERIVAILLETRRLMSEIDAIGVI
jgi:type I restriction-modification system DNA methylase subunit